MRTTVTLEQRLADRAKEYTRRRRASPKLNQIVDQFEAEDFVL